MSGIEDRVRDQVLGIFRAFNVGAEEYLPEQSLMGNIMDFTPPERQVVDQVVEEMILEGIVEEVESPPGLRLTQKGQKIAYDQA